MDALIAAAKDKSPDVRRHVISALGEIGDTRAMDALTQALKDEDAGIRRAAAAAIAEIGGDGDGHSLHIRIRTRIPIRIHTRTPIRTRTRIRIPWDSTT